MIILRICIQTLRIADNRNSNQNMFSNMGLCSDYRNRFNNRCNYFILFVDTFSKYLFLGRGATLSMAVASVAAGDFRSRRTGVGQFLLEPGTSIFGPLISDQHFLMTHKLLHCRSRPVQSEPWDSRISRIQTD